MKYLDDMKIGMKLNVGLGLVMVVIFTALGFVIIRMQIAKITEDTDLRMTEHVNDLAQVINLEIEKNREKVDIAKNLAHYYFYSLGSIRVQENKKIPFEATNQIDKSVHYLKVNTWYLNGELLHNNQSIVDAIKEMGIETVAIFQKIPQGYLRIATNVIQEDGTRALGTFIPNDSPVAEKIAKNEEFHGRAFVVNDWYLTAYEPIIINGEIQGILYVGLKEKNLDGIRSMCQEKKYFKTGYPFLIREDGTFIIHPTKEGENFAEAEFFQQMIANPNKQGKSQYTWEGKRKFQYFKYLDSIKAFISVSIYENELLDIINQGRMAFFIAFFVAIAFFVFISMRLAKLVSKGIDQAVEFVTRVANGDLKTTLDIKRNDEVGKLAQSIDKMIIKLREIVEGIRSGANNIATASQQMSSTSEQLSQSTNIQAASVEEVSSTIQEMTGNIQQNTQNALQTEKISVTSKDEIEGVSKRANEVAEANRIITEKIKIINDIAFQTNILALNAAVEAVRAGDHGRGFAVVATEVKRLAERSKTAGAEIVDSAQQSLELAESTEQKMNEILPEVIKSTSFVQEITVSSLEQKNATEEVNNAVNQLNDMTQQNAVTSEELASGAEELAAQADQLTELISYFKINIGNDQQKPPEIQKPDTKQRIKRAHLKVTHKKIKNSDTKGYQSF
ncbi:methyl-accepting chemotaxis protein [Marinilabiliaceae bacterium JC017]|nr:methyl-accepting chemotaxis protein [Marinilabiliaceae bacterium JC017]